MTADLRVLSQTRLAEAQALLAAGHPSGAYYMAGYAIECAVKAIIVKDWTTETSGYSLPPKRQFQDTFVHDPTKLIGVAGLAVALQTEARTNPTFGANWELVKDWNETSRYETWSVTDAQEMVDAIADPTDGVLRWLQARW